MWVGLAALAGLPMLQAVLERSLTLPIGPSRMLTIGLCAVALVPLALAGVSRLSGGSLSTPARWTVALLVPVLAIAHLLVLTRFADGPFGPVPGGPFYAHASPAPSDWSGAASLRYAEIEVDPRRARTLETLVLVHDGGLYVAANMPEDKRWPRNMREAITARVRLGSDSVYATRPRFVVSSAETDRLLDAMIEKYGFDVSLGGPIWFFRLEP